MNLSEKALERLADATREIDELGDVVVDFSDDANGLIDSVGILLNEIVDFLILENENGVKSPETKEQKIDAVRVLDELKAKILARMPL